MQAWEKEDTGNKEVSTSIPTKNSGSEKTGFKSKAMMLVFIILVMCNGDHDRMTTTKTSLTWLEECFFYLQYIWGRTLTRWVDAEDKVGLSEKRAHVVFGNCLTKFLACQDSWPKYAHHEEDYKMEKEV